MDVYNTQLEHQTDVPLSYVLQIPQGTPFKLKVEPGQYSFYINGEILNQIQQAQKIGSSLYIPPKLLAPLWYYTCFNDNIGLDNQLRIILQKPNVTSKSFVVKFLKLIRIKSLRNQTRFSSGITFNCYYNQDKSNSDYWEDRDIVLQSDISFDGDIIHKIQNDLIKDSNCLQIVSAHYWLIEQILVYLRTKLNFLAWELASLFPGSFLACKLHLMHSIAVSLSILFGVGISIVFGTIHYWLVNQLPKSTAINSKYHNWFVWGLTCLTPSVFLNYTDFLFLLFLSLIGPIIKRIFRWIAVQIGKSFLRWLFA